MNARSYQLLFETSASILQDMFEEYYKIYSEFRKIGNWIEFHSFDPNYKLPDFHDTLMEIIMNDPLLIDQTPWLNYVLEYNFGCNII